jgi:hypothetical protein
MEDEIKSQGNSEANNNQNSGQENSQNSGSSYGQNAGQSSSNNNYQQLADDRGESWPSSDNNTNQSSNNYQGADNNNNQNFNNNQGFSNNNAPQFNQPPVPAKKSGVLKWVLIILITFVALSIVGLLLFFFLYIPRRPEYKMAKMAENLLTTPAPQTSTTVKFSSVDGNSLFDVDNATIKIDSAMSSGKIQLNMKVEDISKNSRSTSSFSTNSDSSSDMGFTSLKGVGASGVYADGQMYFKLNNAENAIKTLGLDSPGFSIKNNQWYSYKLSGFMKDSEQLKSTTCVLSKAGQPLFTKEALSKYSRNQNLLGLYSQFVFSEGSVNGQGVLVVSLDNSKAKNIDKTLETEESIEMQKNFIKDSSVGSCFSDQQISDFIKQESDSANSSNKSSNSSNNSSMKLYIGSDNQLKKTEFSSEGFSITTDYTYGSTNIETPSGAKALDN